MCVVSAVSDQWGRDWNIDPNLLPKKPFTIEPFVSKEEHKKLKKEVEELAKALREARAEDQANNEPNCVKGEKTKALIDILKKVSLLSNELKELTNEILNIITEGLDGLEDE